MGNENIGEMILFFQFVEQIQHLGLHRHIQSGHGLIANDESRIHRQGTRDGYALALTAGEFVRITVKVRFVQIHTLQQGYRLPFPLLVIAPDIVHTHRFHQCVTNCKSLV